MFFSIRYENTFEKGTNLHRRSRGSIWGFPEFFTLNLILCPPGSKRSSNLNDKWNGCQYFLKEKTNKQIDDKY